MLVVVEIDADERISANIVFDPDDFEAAIAELDARYLAGEADRTRPRGNGHTGLRRTQPARASPHDARWVSVDHRRGRAFAPGDLPAYLDASWELMPQSSLYIDDVHRLNDIGTVITHVGKGTSGEGFVAEWRSRHDEGRGRTGQPLRAVRRGRCGHRARAVRPVKPAHKAIGKTASRVNARFVACVNARDWDAIASILADNHYSDDRRRVTGAGTRRGRDPEIENMRVVADLGAETAVEVIATRGDRLVLTRTHVSTQQGFLAEVLGLIETDLDGRMAGIILLDPEDIDAALEELDARTSPAKRPATRTRGPLSQGLTPRLIGTKYL